MNFHGNFQNQKFTFVHSQFKTRSQPPSELFSTDLSRHIICHMCQI